MSANNSPEKIDTQESTENGLGARSRNLTEKGHEHQISVCEQKLRSAISSWRRQLNKLLVEISDSDNIETIREKRDLFQLNFDAIFTNFENLQSLKDDVKTEASKLENIEVEHQQAMQNVMQRIRELDSVKYELGSNVSGKSFKSAISTSQSSSSKKSDSSRISNVAAKRAALKTKLKYIDIESKCLAELQKIKPSKK